jgi:hypothetical protein
MQFLNIIYVKYKLLRVKHVTDQQIVISLTHLKMSTRETGKVWFRNNDPFPVLVTTVLNPSSAVPVY